MSSESGEALPRWVRTGFWTVVALEWTVAVALAAVILFAVIQVGMWASCFPDQTIYASGYSQSGWEGVSVGDTQETVLAALGQPLRRSTHNTDEWWAYSKEGPASDSYRQRWLRFGANARLLEKQDACYID